MRIAGVIQARLSSSRLFGKILLPLERTPLLAVLVERTKRARVDEWWLATSSEATDDLTAAWGEALGLQVYRGALDDVLSRFTSVARSSGADWIVRLTADDPFTDASAVDALVTAARAAPPECVLLGDGLGPERRFPLGYMPQIVRTDALFEAERSIPSSQPHHRAHVVSWHLDRGGYRPVAVSGDHLARPQWRWTVDTIGDYRMASAAFAIFGERWPTLTYREMVGILDSRQDVVSLNEGVQQKAIAEG